MKTILFYLLIFLSVFSCNSTNYINRNNDIFNLDKSLEEIIETKDTEIFRLISEVEMSGSSDILVIKNKNDVFFNYLHRFLCNFYCTHNF